MSALRGAYLLLALWGAVQPGLLTAAWLRDNGPDPQALLAAWMAGAADGALFWQLVVASLALVLWILAEVAVRRNWEALLAIPATVIFGIGCGLPLYLFLRTRPVR